MAKLTILTGSRMGAEIWASVWKLSHPEGEIYNEYVEESETLAEAWQNVEGFDIDTVVIPNSTDEITLLDFSDEPIEPHIGSETQAGA